MVFSLFSAWTLMLLHSIIPHTHPESHDHLNVHSHLSSSHHEDVHHHLAHHHHPKKDGDKEKKPGAHFSHAPDFGEFLIKPSFSPKDLKINDSDQSECIFAFIGITTFNEPVSKTWVLQKPPPIEAFLSFSFALRGPPSLLI